MGGLEVLLSAYLLAVDARTATITQSIATFARATHKEEMVLDTGTTLANVDTTAGEWYVKPDEKKILEYIRAGTFTLYHPHPPQTRSTVYDEVRINFKKTLEALPQEEQDQLVKSLAADQEDGIIFVGPLPGHGDFEVLLGIEYFFAMYHPNEHPTFRLVNVMGEKTQIIEYGLKPEYEKKVFDIAQKDSEMRSFIEAQERPLVFAANVLNMSLKFEKDISVLDDQVNAYACQYWNISDIYHCEHKEHPDINELIDMINKNTVFSVKVLE